MLQGLDEITPIATEFEDMNSLALAICSPSDLHETACFFFYPP